MIREERVLDAFPGRPELDLYLWIIRHREQLALEAFDVLHIGLGDIEVLRSVNELSVTRVYPDVGDPPAVLVEEDQVAGPLLTLGDSVAHAVLLVVPVR